MPVFCHSKIAKTLGIPDFLSVVHYLAEGGVTTHPKHQFLYGKILFVVRLCLRYLENCGEPLTRSQDTYLPNFLRAFSHKANGSNSSVASISSNSFAKRLTLLVRNLILLLYSLLSLYKIKT